MKQECEPLKWAETIEQEQDDFFLVFEYHQPTKNPPKNIHTYTRDEREKKRKKKNVNKFEPYESICIDKDVYHK